MKPARLSISGFCSQLTTFPPDMFVSATENAAAQKFAAPVPLLLQWFARYRGVIVRVDME